MNRSGPTASRFPRSPILGLAFVVVVVAVLGLSNVAGAGAWTGAGIEGKTSATSANPLASNGGEWPTYLQNPTRTSANLAATTLSVANISELTTTWSYHTTGAITGSTTVVGGVAYVGAWNGYEYALNSSTGVLLWKSFLGITKSSNCGTQGIASSATVQNGSLYIGGGDGYWYAVNTSTGAVEWKVLVGSPSAGYYNWASPLLYNGYAYVGVSSFCDEPLVPGGLLQINLTTHAIQGMFHTTPHGELGASVWGSPSVNASANTVYFATGNNKSHSPGEFDNSIVAINASTRALISTWHIPEGQEIEDGDFGSSATLFSTSTGVAMVGALDKNGYFYAWNAADLSAGPVWLDKLTTGQSVGSAAFANGLVFVGTGTATYKGVHSSGAAWALNPSTGAVVWEQPLWGKSVSAPAYVNGLLLVDGGTHLFVLNAATGTKLKELECPGAGYSPPAVAEGRIYFACQNGYEYAYGPPESEDPVTSPAATHMGAAVGFPLIARPRMDVPPTP